MLEINEYFVPLVIVFRWVSVSTDYHGTMCVMEHMFTDTPKYWALSIPRPAGSNYDHTGLFLFGFFQYGFSWFCMKYCSNSTRDLQTFNVIINYWEINELLPLTYEWWDGWISPFCLFGLARPCNIMFSCNILAWKQYGCNTPDCWE